MAKAHVCLASPWLKKTQGVPKGLRTHMKEKVSFHGLSFAGTNDKAGGPHYMLKWASPQSVKQTFVPLKDVEYPYMKN